MAATITAGSKIISNFGDKFFIRFDVTLGTYTTGGVSLTAANLGLSNVEILLASRSDGYLFYYDHTNNLMLAYRQGADLSGGGTIENVDIDTTASSVTVAGGQATGVDLFLTEDSATGQLGKEATGDITIPRSTFGLTAASFALATTPTLSGATVSSTAALQQVANGTDLGGVSVRCIVIGV